jgi:hypothetical protein
LGFVKGSDRLRAALATEDRDEFLSVLASNVVWCGHQELGNGGLQCASRDEVAEVFDSYIAAGHTGKPEIIAEVADGLVVRMQDYPDRASALKAVGLES